MKYKFVGEGLGVPGLPHEITDEEAVALGVKDILDGAIRNGNYRGVTAMVSPAPTVSRATPDRRSKNKESEA